MITPFLGIIIRIYIYISTAKLLLAPYLELFNFLTKLFLSFKQLVTSYRIPNLIFSQWEAWEGNKCNVSTFCSAKVASHHYLCIFYHVHMHKGTMVYFHQYLSCLVCRSYWRLSRKLVHRKGPNAVVSDVYSKLRASKMISQNRNCSVSLWSIRSHQK